MAWFGTCQRVRSSDRWCHSGGRGKSRSLRIRELNIAFPKAFSEGHSRPPGHGVVTSETATKPRLYPRLKFRVVPLFQGRVRPAMTWRGRRRPIRTTFRSYYAVTGLKGAYQ